MFSIESAGQELTRKIFTLGACYMLQAESEHHIKDTYNYVTIMSDIKMPKRHFKFLEDNYRHDAFEQAIKTALHRIEAEDKDARVLHLGAGAGQTSNTSVKFVSKAATTNLAPLLHCIMKWGQGATRSPRVILR